MNNSCWLICQCSRGQKGVEPKRARALLNSGDGESQEIGRTHQPVRNFNMGVSQTPEFPMISDDVIVCGCWWRPLRDENSELSDLIILSMTQTAFILDHEEYVRYAARRAIHQHIYGSVGAPGIAKLRVV
eukprot:s2495_g8.t1